MGMVPEYVFARGLQFSGAVESRGEVGGEEGPDGESATPFAAEGELAVCACVGEEDVDEVGEEQGPEDWDAAPEEEDGD